MGFFTDKFSEEIWRVKYAGEFETVEDYYASMADRVAFGDPETAFRFYTLLIEKRFSPGGRILAWAGRQGSRVSLMNCTTHAIADDTLEAISDAAYIVMRAGSRGQGIGLDISALRPADSPVNNAAKTSTGAISFMEMLNAVGGTIGQEGRRSALLFSMAVDHPDVWRPYARDVKCPKCSMGCLYCEFTGYIPYDFLHIKQLPGKVEGANISVMVTDEFMQAVREDRQFSLRFAGESSSGEFSVNVNIRAKDLFRKLAEGAHGSAEPGILYWDTSKKMSNSDLFGDEWNIAGVNACSEEVLDQDGVCNLGSINLSAYVVNPFTPGAYIDTPRLFSDTQIAVEFLDNVLELELQNGTSISAQQRRSIEYLRRIGLGVMGLADAMAMLGVRYGSRHSVDVTEEFMATIMLAAYDMSVRLARKNGAAKVWDAVPVAEREKLVEHGFFRTLPDSMKWRISRYGTRNVTLLSVAPTGTISNLLGVSSGIEPVFAHAYTRRTRINGHDEFIDYVHPGIRLSRAAGIDDSVYPTAYEVSPDGHLSVHAAAQKYVDASISKTINFPASASVEDIERAYMLAWERGLKGLSVYRDGSRDIQVLYTNASADDKCPECGGSVVHKEGCKECSVCQWSVCSV